MKGQAADVSAACPFWLLQPFLFSSADHVFGNLPDGVAFRVINHDGSGKADIAGRSADQNVVSSVFDDKSVKVVIVVGKRFFIQQEGDFLLFSSRKKYLFKVRKLFHRFGNRRDGVAHIQLHGLGPIPVSCIDEGEGHLYIRGCSLLPDDKILFSGDTLFRASIGRTDFEGGSYDQICDAIHRKLFVLPDDTHVLPGHMGDTTIGFEKRNNPFV